MASDRRPSSRVVRKRCYEYWKTPDDMLICYLCGRVLDPTKKYNGESIWEAEHDLARWLGGSDDPPNVKPCCNPTCEGLDGIGHKEKTKVDTKNYHKTENIHAKRLGFTRVKHKVQGSKGTKWGKKYNRATGRFEAFNRETKQFASDPKKEET
jgi:hypothetical protein